MFTRRDLMIATMLLAAAPARGQLSLDRIYSHPKYPPAEVLRKLDLNLAWATAVPMDGSHDRITFTVVDRSDLFVLTASGQVVRIDAESGRIEWRVRPSKPYAAVPNLAVNQRSVYVIMNAKLFSIDREIGAVKWEYPIPGGLSASPVVDADQIYIARSDGHLAAFTLPFVQLTRDGSPGRSLIYAQRGLSDRPASAPTPKWDINTYLDLAFQPVISPDTIFVIAPNGKGKAFHKFKEIGVSQEAFRFETEGRVTLPPGGYGPMALIPCDDTNVYALNIDTGRTAWRYTAGTSIRWRPVALEEDVYVTSSREGLARVDRATGEPMWRVPVGDELHGTNPDADRFLAASARYVYALDAAGRLVVLDRRRGVTLARVDKSAYRVPVVNQVTDRVYLAGNDGTLICLHDRAQVEPLRHRRKLEIASSAITRTLDTPVDERPGEPVALDNVLARLRSRYGVNYVYATELLKAASMENVGRQEVQPRLIENKPLKDVYKALLKQVNAGYRVEDNTLLIVPADKASDDGKAADEPKKEAPKKAPKKDDDGEDEPKKDDKKAPKKDKDDDDEPKKDAKKAPKKDDKKDDE